MNEHDVRVMLLARAVEQNDPQHTILSDDARRRLVDARTHAGGVLEYARAVVDLLAAQSPVAAQAFARSAWPRWLVTGAAVVAAFTGLALNELGSGAARVNLLSIPLGAMMAWNLLVYLVLAASMVVRLVRRGRAGPGPARCAVTRLAHAVFTRGLPGLPGRSGRGRGGAALRAAVLQFSADWLRIGAPLHQVRIRMLLHVCAAALALGTIAGMYLRGIGFEFLAGWESTFLDEHAVHRWLSFVLGPAAALTGADLPGPQHLAELRWSPGHPGENAARWIHLYAASAAIVIVLPRATMAMFERVRAGRLARALPWHNAQDAWWRQFERIASGRQAQVRVVPYSHTPSAAVLDGVARALAAAVGEAVALETSPALPYGADAGAIERSADGVADGCVLLFNAAATPEDEIHGEAAARLTRVLAQRAGEPVALVLVDESSLRARLAGQAGAEQRVNERRLAWQRVLDAAGVRSAALDLAMPDARLPDPFIEALHRPARVAARHANAERNR